MKKQHLASQCQGYSSMQEQMRRRQYQQSITDQREWMCHNAQMQTPPQPHKLPGLSVDVRITPSQSVPKGRLWHCPKSTVGEVEFREAIPFAIRSAIIDALDYARTKHPHFADTDAEAGNVILEELLEVTEAALKVVRCINDQVNRDNLFTELAQVNATAIRMMERMLK